MIKPSHRASKLKPAGGFEQLRLFLRDAAVSWETAVNGSTRHLADPFEP
jgi:hypothetical protein